MAVEKKSTNLSFQSTLVMGNLLMRDPWLQPGTDWKCILGKKLSENPTSNFKETSTNTHFQYIRMENPGFHRACLHHDLS